MIRVFKKIAGAFVHVGRFIVKRETLSALSEVAVFIPVVGKPLALALDYVEEAEEMFSEPKSGEEKLAWVLEKLQGALNKVGYSEKRIDALILMALLILKGEAEIRGVEENC